MIVYLLFFILHFNIILALKYYNNGLIKLFLNNNNILINIIYQYIVILIKIQYKHIISHNTFRKFYANIEQS